MDECLLAELTPFYTCFYLYELCPAGTGTAFGIFINHSLWQLTELLLSENVRSLASCKLHLDQEIFDFKSALKIWTFI